MDNKNCLFGVNTLVSISVFVTHNNPALASTPAAATLAALGSSDFITVAPSILGEILVIADVSIVAVDVFPSESIAITLEDN